jgi:hypothetical protein
MCDSIIYNFYAKKNTHIMFNMLHTLISKTLESTISMQKGKLTNVLTCLCKNEHSLMFLLVFAYCTKRYIYFKHKNVLTCFHILHKKVHLLLCFCILHKKVHLLSLFLHTAQKGTSTSNTKMFLLVFAYCTKRYI